MSDVYDVEAVNEKNDKSLDIIPYHGDNIVSIAENAEKMVNAVKKIKRIALSVTNDQDWVDQGGKPYLWASGAEKVARLFGISWRIEEPLFEVFDDGYFQYTYKGKFQMGRHEIEAIGTRSSKDLFFSATKNSDKEGNRILKPPSEIDRGDVKKAAYTNCIGNGVTRILGIRNLTWDDIKGAGIDMSKVSKINYKSKEKTDLSSEAKQKRKAIGEMLMEISGGDINKSQDLLESFTTFEVDGKEIKGKRSLEELSEKQIAVVYGKTKDKYKKRKENDSNVDSADGSKGDSGENKGKQEKKD